jgi:hypothetical protein
MSEQSLQLLESIKKRLQFTVRRKYVTEAVYGLVLLAGSLAAIWLVFAAMEAGFWMEVAWRQVAFWTILVLTAGLLVWFVALPLLRMAGLIPGYAQDSIAVDIGRSFPQISDRLINLLHLADGRRSNSPDAFVEHAVRSLSHDIESVDFEEMETFDRALKASRFASLPLLGLLVFLRGACQR